MIIMIQRTLLPSGMGYVQGSAVCLPVYAPRVRGIVGGMMTNMGNGSHVSSLSFADNEFAHGLAAVDQEKCST